MPIPHHLPAIDPPSEMIKITASDSTVFATCRGLLVGTAGAATVRNAAGRVCEAYPLQQGYNPGYFDMVYSTGLTASNIWALY